MKYLELLIDTCTEFKEGYASSKPLTSAAYRRLMGEINQKYKPVPDSVIINLAMEHLICQIESPEHSGVIEFARALEKLINGGVKQ